MSVIGVDPTSVRQPGQPAEFKYGTVAEVTDRFGFTRIYQYASVTLGATYPGSVVLLSSGGSARNVTIGRAASGVGDSVRVGVSISDVPNGGAGWFQVYGACSIYVNGPTPAHSKLYATNSDGMVANEVSDSAIVGLVTTTGAGSEGTIPGYISWANALTILGGGGGEGPQGPQGEPGEPGSAGPSAYDVAVAEGFIGTEEEWLETLVGPQGPSGGENGDSAYEIAVANGFVGSEAEWLDSLVGPQGPQGPEGPPGEGESTGVSIDDLDVRFVDDYGAIGDWTSHPLSESYGTLGAAQVDYPYATALTQEKDYCALLEAMYGNGVATGVEVRWGGHKGYMMGKDTIRPTKRVKLVGQGAWTTVYWSKTSDDPLFGTVGILIDNAAASLSVFEKFVAECLSTGGRATGGVLREYNPTTGMIICQKGTNGCANRTFELRDANAPTPAGVQANFTTGDASPVLQSRTIKIVGGNQNAFILGETITGASSGATAKVGYTGYRFPVLVVDVPVGSFLHGETITGGTSGTTAICVEVINVPDMESYPVTINSGALDADPNAISTFVEAGSFADGIRAQFTVTLKDIDVKGFGGHGIHIVAGSTPFGGNANRSHLEYVSVYNAGGSGICIAGADANVVSGENINTIACFGWGINDRAFLGGSWASCHTSVCLTGGHRIRSNSDSCGLYSEGGFECRPFRHPVNAWSNDAVIICGQNGLDEGVGSSALRLKGDRIQSSYFTAMTSGVRIEGGTTGIGGDPQLSIAKGGNAGSTDGVHLEFRPPWGSGSSDGGTANFWQKGAIISSYSFGTSGRLAFSITPGSGSYLTATDAGGGAGFRAWINCNGSGAITEVNIVSFGTGYTWQTVIVVTNPSGGTGAILLPRIERNGIITGITIINGGTGYKRTFDWYTAYKIKADGRHFYQQIFSGEPVYMAVEGADTNIDFSFHPKGTGSVVVPKLKVGTVDVISGAGSPEGVVTAPVGSMYTRTNGGAGTTLYIKESGTGNTGWVAK